MRDFYMKEITAFFVFVFLSIFNILGATDAEYGQLRAYLKARFQKETYVSIALDFEVDSSTVSRFVNEKIKNSATLLSKARTKYPNIFQPIALVQNIVVAPIVPLVLDNTLIGPVGAALAPAIPVHLVVQKPVIKQEPKLEIPSDYLSLPNLEGGSKYVISMAPMNSSGDSYHILAYLILAKSHRKTIPDIILTYDGAAEKRDIESKMNTYTQVQRTLHFAQVLGYGDYFRIAFIDTGNCQRENNRQHKLEEHLKKMDYTHFIDQKALTTMISEHFRKFYKEDTSRRLREGLNKYSTNYLSQPACKKLVKDARDEVKRIGLNQNPLFVMHVRYSSKANEKQNMEGGVIGKLSNYIKSKGYNVWFIFTDGRKNGSFKSLGNDRTDPFPYTTEDGKDNGKYFHMQILLNLRNLPNLRGIIGNTSGTLDLAGFLGHKVYNLHNVEQSLDYQSCRILIQSSFLTAERLDFGLLENSLKNHENKLGEFNSAVVQEHLPHLNDWMTGAVQKIATANAPQSIIRSNTAGYCEMFFIKKIINNALEPLQSLSSTISYLQSIEPKIKIEV